MAAWFRGLLLLLIPLALAETDLPCDGYEVLPGFGVDDVEMPTQLGVKLLEYTEDVADEQTCWGRCCDNDGCDLAVMSAGKCYLLRCTLKGHDLCDVTEKEGVTSYRKINRGDKPTQEDFCLPEKATGPCRASFKRWYYDAETETCMNFTYGGCPVNLNNHVGEEECMQKCQGAKAGKPAEAPSKRTVSADPLPESKPEPAAVQAPKERNYEDYCAAPAFTGHCRAAFPRWFFDPSSSSCKKFIYGGCKANKNNYITETDCMNTCSGHAEDGDYTDHNIMHRSVTAVVLPILLALLAAALIGIMILFFVKVAKKNQDTASFRAMWTPIDDKECLMNSAYTL